MEDQFKKLTVSTPMEADSKFDTLTHFCIRQERSLIRWMWCVTPTLLSMKNGQFFRHGHPTRARWKLLPNFAVSLQAPLFAGTASWTLYEHLMRNTATINRFLTTSASSQRKMLACSEQGRVCAALTIKGTRLTRATVKCHSSCHRGVSKTNLRWDDETHHRSSSSNRAGFGSSLASGGTGE